MEATRLLSEWASTHNRRLIFTSTDLVFDGDKGWYREDDLPRPTLVYGQTKHAAERFVLDGAKSMVARLSLLYGPSRSGRPGFFDRAVSALRAGTPQVFFIDEFRTALDYSTAATVLVRMAESETPGFPRGRPRAAEPLRVDVPGRLGSRDRPDAGQAKPASRRDDAGITPRRRLT